MTPNEFMFWYVVLPWGLAIFGGGIGLLVFVLGGPELKTIMGARMDPRCQLVFSWVDGGHATLEKYRPFEHGVLENDNQFLLYATPLGDKTYQPQLLSVDQVKRAMPDLDAASVEEVVKTENEKRLAKAQAYASDMPKLNEAAKSQCTFAGKPCWIGHRSLGVALTPAMLELAERRKRRIGKKASMASIETTEVDSIKDFLTMNFSPRRLFQIWRSGEDAGLHGRPKKPFPTFLIVVLLGAVVFLIIGALILTGKVDLGGFARGIMG